MNEPIWVPTSYPAPESPFESRPLTSITKLVIHHTAGPLDQSPLEIDAEERAGGDYIYVPYTWFVDYKGNKYVARPPGVVSAATFGWNKESVAICAIGNYERSVAGFTGLPTDALLEAIIQVSVYAHQLCPNIDDTWDASRSRAVPKTRTIRSSRHIQRRETRGLLYPLPGRQLRAKVPYIKEVHGQNTPQSTANG